MFSISSLSNFLQYTLLRASPTHYTTLATARKMVRTENKRIYHKSRFSMLAELFQLTYKKAQQVPQDKFEYPVTEAQEIGWFSASLVDQQRNDPRLHHPKNHSEITKFMDAYWRQKEQEKLQE